MSDEPVAEPLAEPKLKLPVRDAQAKQAFVAIALIFFVGIAVGFVLAKAF